MPSRTRWKLFAVLTAVMIVGTVGLYRWESKPPKRIEFVGPVDPATGYRCRFSLSSEWRMIDEQENDMVSAIFFSPSRPNPIRAWLATHLFHPGVPSAAITLFSPRNSADSVLQVQGGYPELSNPAPQFVGGVLRPPAAQPSVITHRHLRIDGFPATVVTTSSKSERVTFLLVYVPNQEVSYRVAGTGTPYNASETNREMQAIISSFHVEKVAPASGKR